MNKASLIDKIVGKTGIERRLVAQVLDVFEETVIERLKAGDEVTLTGFGTFIAKFRSARGGVNPQKPAETGALATGQDQSRQTGEIRFNLDSPHRHPEPFQVLDVFSNSPLQIKYSNHM